MQIHKILSALTVISLTGLSIFYAPNTYAGGDKNEIPRVLERFADYKVEFLNLKYEDQQKILGNLEAAIKKYGESNTPRAARIELTLKILLSEFEKYRDDLGPATDETLRLAEDKLQLLDSILADEVDTFTEELIDNQLLKKLKYTANGSASIVGNLGYTNMGEDFMEEFEITLGEYYVMQNIFDMILKSDISFDMDSDTFGGKISIKGVIENLQTEGKQFIKIDELDMESDIMSLQSIFEDFHEDVPMGTYMLVNNANTHVIESLQKFSSEEFSQLLKQLLKTQDFTVISTTGDKIYLSLNQDSCTRIKKSVLGIYELFGEDLDESTTCSKSDLRMLSNSIGKMYLEAGDISSTLNIESPEGIKVSIVFNNTAITSIGFSYSEEDEKLSFIKSGDNFSFEVSEGNFDFVLVQKDGVIAGKLTPKSQNYKTVGLITGKGDLLSGDIDKLNIELENKNANGTPEGKFNLNIDDNNYTLDINIGTYYSIHGEYNVDTNGDASINAYVNIMGVDMFNLSGAGKVTDTLVELEYKGNITIPSTLNSSFSGNINTLKNDNNTKQNMILDIEANTNMQELDNIKLHLDITSDETRKQGKTTEVNAPKTYETLD